MKKPPIIDLKYIVDILQLHEAQLVSDIDILEVIESNTALIIKFKVITKEESHKDSTRQFFIKTIKYNPKTNAYDALSIKEVEFYKFIKNITDINLPIAQCFDAYIAENKDKYLLLLEDLSKDFYPPRKVDLTSEGIWFSAACSLANLHTTFWNSTQIGSNHLIIDSMEEINTYIKNTYDSYEKFMKYAGDRFDEEILTIFEHALRIAVELETERYKRISTKDNITLINGDSHIYNFMFPYNQNKSSIIIDFQFWGVGIGPRDLAHLTRESFPKTYGEEFHKLLMRKYHDTLLLNGIRGYSWNNCWNDYRKQVASMLLIPMFQYTFFNLKYDDWINDISSLIFTYKLLHCEQLEV